MQVTEDDHEWIQNGKTHKLRSRKGRSIVHKNLEDNYGAVIVANHEALAQVLENVSDLRRTYNVDYSNTIKYNRLYPFNSFHSDSTNCSYTPGSKRFEDIEPQME